MEILKDLTDLQQKQLPEGVLWKSCAKQFFKKIDEEKPKMETFFSKVTTLENTSGKMFPLTVAMFCWDGFPPWFLRTVNRYRNDVLKNQT